MSERRSSTPLETCAPEALGITVGVGGSAGALEAFELLLRRLPRESGMSFIIVQHQDPRQDSSLLPSLLARHTAMPVVSAEQDARLQPNCVYVVPPDQTLTVGRDRLHLSQLDKSAGGPIDLFLTSLAKARAERAVGIVLSGSGSDGTAGLRAIRQSGGLSLAQSPETAKFDSMPRSALSAGVVDHVLPVEEIPEKLLAYSRELGDDRRAQDAAVQAEVRSNLKTICSILQRATGHDFSHYKEGTLLRRIQRRLSMTESTSTQKVGDYVRRLEREDEEAQRLLQEILVGVTSFFREPDAFESLAKQVIPALLEGRSPEAPVRIWVPGCASGEEAYSLAILLREQMSRRDWGGLVQIYATDIDAQALDVARTGVYPGDIAGQVSPERLARFFERRGADYQIVRELREMCVFCVHDLLQNPPFSSMDLISCRNVLIYLEPIAQKKLTSLFHYALRSSGYLFLGLAEGPADNDGLFTALDKKHKIFQRRNVARRLTAGFPHGEARDIRSGIRRPHKTDVPNQQQAIEKLERMLRTEYLPPSAVVDPRGEVVYLTGHTGRYLQEVGTPTNNIFHMTEGILRAELRVALRKAFQTHAKVVSSNIWLEAEKGARFLHLEVSPIRGLAPEVELMAIVLQESAAAHEPGNEGTAALTPDRSLVDQLEDELQAARTDLKSGLEELESTNEELVTTNEELQSANEELQTSQEELQSLNEELQTVNAELREKIEELGAANSDLQNLFASTQIATIFLDRDLEVTKFTPAARALFHNIERDVGRPIDDLAPRLIGEDLAADAREVLRTVRPVERQVGSADGQIWFILRILPYRTGENEIAGVVVTFVDVSELKRAQEALSEAARRYRIVADFTYDWEAWIGLDGRYLYVSPSCERITGYTREELLRDPDLYLRIVEPEDRELLASHLAPDRFSGPPCELEFRVRRRDGQVRWIGHVCQPVLDTDGKPLGRRASNREITERKIAEEALRAANLQLIEADRRKNEFLAILSHELRNPLAPIRSSLYVMGHATPGGEQAKRAQEVIERQVGHMTRLVDDLLDVMRITVGKVRLQREPLELNELMRRTVDDHLTVFANSSIKIEALPAPSDVWVNGDRTRIAQAIGNLLQNSAKFTPRGGKVTVSVRADASLKQAVLSVRDTGCGIPPELLSRLFQPFMQADASLDRRKGGLGLGLALVKGLVEMQGGSVNAESAGRGKGATFTLRMPLEEASLSKTFAMADRSPGGRETARRVLIIEDNVDAADSLRAVLELREHAVELAYDGYRGLEKARTSPPDIVLCDIGLPGMDGYDVARAMRGDPKLRDVVLVALSGYAMPDDITKANEAGFDNHLAKPPRIEELQRLLETLPAARAAGDGAPRQPHTA